MLWSAPSDYDWSTHAPWLLPTPPVAARVASVLSRARGRPPHRRAGLGSATALPRLHLCGLAAAGDRPAGDDHYHATRTDSGGELRHSRHDVPGEPEHGVPARDQGGLHDGEQRLV